MFLGQQFLYLFQIEQYIVNTQVLMRKSLSTQLIESILVRFTLNLPEYEYEPFRLVHHYYRAYYYYLDYFKMGQLKNDKEKSKEQWLFFTKINDCMPDEYRLLHSEIQKSIELKNEIPLCGAIVVSSFQDETVYLLVQDKRTGKYGFPKGKLQEGETLMQCAKRETIQQTEFKIKCIYRLKLQKSRDNTFFFLSRLDPSNQIKKKSVIPKENYQITSIVWATKKELKEYYRLNYPTKLALKTMEN